MKAVTLWLAAAALAMFTAWADAQEVGPDELKRQRAAADATYEASAAECQKRFAVNACKERAREVHRAETARLRVIELAHADAKRRRRAQTYAARVDARQANSDPASDSAAMPPAASASLAELANETSPPSAGTMSAAVATAAVPSADPQAIKPSKPAEPGRAATEKANREKFQERQHEAAEHRQQMERRNAEREQRKKAAPLPVPASAASAP